MINCSGHSSRKAFSAETALNNLETKSLSTEYVNPSDDLRTSYHRVYNFEVAEHHTYIADGIRVHNTSILGLLSDADLASIAAGTLVIEDLTDSDPTQPGLDRIVFNLPNGEGRTEYKVTLINGEPGLEFYHTYSNLQGEIVQLQGVRDADGNIAGEPTVVVLEGARRGEEVGTLLTPFLVNALIGEDASPFEQIATTTILGTFVENLFEATGGLIGAPLQSDFNEDGAMDGIATLAFQDFGIDLAETGIDNASALLSQWISAEVFSGLSSDTLAEDVVGRLLNTGVDYIIDIGIHALLSEIGAGPALLDRIDPGPIKILTADFPLAGVGGLFLTTALNRALPDIETVEGQIAAGFTTLAIKEFLPNLHSLGTGIFGSGAGVVQFHPATILVSFAVGKIFDTLFEKNPEAYTNVIYNDVTGLFEIGSSWEEDGGNVELSKQLAGYYVEFMNGIFEQTQSQSNNFNEIGDELRLVFGHYEEHILNGGKRSFENLDSAFKARVIDTIQEIDLIDGELKFGDVIARTAAEADFIDYATHYYFQVYSGTFRKKTKITEINKGVETDGASNELLISIVEQADLADDGDIRSYITNQANRLYGDIPDFYANGALEAALKHFSTEDWKQGYLLTKTESFWRQTGDGEEWTTRTVYDEELGIQIISNVLYLRAVVLKLESKGYAIDTKTDVIDALIESEIFIKPKGLVFEEFEYSRQIAADYQEYLANQEAYDAAFIAAGPNNGFTQSWALTFQEAARLGLIDDYNRTGDDADNLFLASGGGDTIDGAGGDDQIHGYSGDDSLLGGTGDDTLSGGFGQDTLIGGQDADSLLGDSGDDSLSGGAGDDSLSGGAGNDTLTGGMAEDHLFGDADNDHIYGGNADDMLDGGDGDDWLIGGEGADILHGGEGFDTVSYLPSNEGVTINLRNATQIGGDAQGDSLSDIEAVIGSDHADRIYGSDIDNLILGQAGNDRLFARDGDDTVEGGAGNDQIGGGNGDDLLSGGVGDDALYASGQDDTLIGGSGADTLYGGSGFDVVDYSTSYAGVIIKLTTHIQSGGDAQGDHLYTIEAVTGSEFSDQIYGSHDNNFISGGSGEDTLYASHGDDTVEGGGGRDEIGGSYGNDVLHGQKGDDSLFGGSNNDHLHGGLGNDELYGGTDKDTLYGGNGDDTLFGGSHADVLDGGAGIDVASYEGSSVGVDIRLADDLLRGGDAAGDSLVDIEIIHGSNYADRLYGDDQANTFYGLDRNDTIYTRDGDDTVWGGTGNDVIGGGNGDDSLSGGHAYDTLYGGSGDDYISGDGHRDELYGGDGNDALFGGLDRDTLYGGSGDDYISGDEHRDELYGGDGNDALFGGYDRDTLYGGGGDDTLQGGAGADVFVFENGFGSDVIKDFDASFSAEHINLSGVSAITSFGDLQFNHLSQSGNDAVISDGNGNTIRLEGVSISTLSADDFIF
ncbi:intein C-terminal splicing region [Epibacterium ulvae]|uniref:Intein C-terminal splicing region n=1 Tax=Epibacterium ulvae TaxID=1156985 RepID=A0A1G5RBE0_9RHOB|nr:hypothetical protein [Epibacterium ulvae]SCZ71422.1 intein C-terminal splicing region [Epibacterium ulvae]